MLSDEEKTRIKSEEIFRHEIQREIEKQHGKKSKWAAVSSIMNSAFLLWFLSTVLVGAGTFFYARSERRKEDERRQYERKQTQEREMEIAEKKIDAEITSRLNYFSTIYSKEGFKALFILDKPLEASYPVNVFPEYGNRSMQSLLWEMLQVIPQKEKPELVEAYNSAKELSNIWALSQDEEKLSKLVPNLPKDMKVLNLTYHRDDERGTEFDLRRFNLDRWGYPLAGMRNLYDHP